VELVFVAPGKLLDTIDIVPSPKINHTKHKKGGNA
jgi:hypothetical protein